MVTASKGALALSLALACATPLSAQDSIPLAVGSVAPDFALVSATQEGVGDTVRLSDYRDQTVVIAFFYRARTRG
jgi:AhpC/TSA family